jgi:hypothetical protein
LKASSLKFFNGEPSEKRLFPPPLGKSSFAGQRLALNKSMLSFQELQDAFFLSSGVFWTLTYLLIIKRGFQDRTLGIPLAALVTNISWEFIFSFLIPKGTPQVYINVVWFLLDCIIFFQAMRFGKKIFADLFPGNCFYGVLLSALVIAFGSVLSVTYEFKDWSGNYSAFGSNLMMSILFVVMLFQRENIAGQSLYIRVVA